MYIFSNPTYTYYSENVYKIGYSKDPLHRIQALDTAYPEPTIIVYTYYHVNARTLEKLVHKALAMFRLFSNREFFKCEVPTIQKVIESLGNNLVEETNETIIDTTQIGNEHVYETILKAEDVSSQEEFQNLKTKPDLRDKEYHKLIKHVIKRIFNNHINVSLVCMLFEKKTIAKKYINQYRLFKQLINEENNNIEDDCSMFINDIDTHSETYMQREHYCKTLLSIMGFSSIFDVMTKVNTSDAMKALRNNILWLRECYKVHQMWYEYNKSTDDTPCVKWTDQRLRQYIILLCA